MRDLSPNQKAVLLTSAVFIFTLLYTGVAQTSTSTDNWSEGTFKDTTADREDNSGVLGLGYQNGTAQDQLKGYWRFDRESGAFPDYSGNDLTGDIYGADRSAEGILGTTGARFSSNSDEAVILDNSDLDLQEGFTISSWAKINENIDVNPSMSQNPSFYQKGSAYNLKVENPKTIAYSTGSEIVFLDSTGQKDNVTATANAIGNLKDFDNDQELEVPFVDGNNNLKIVDRNGNTEELVTGGVKSQNTVLSSGDLDGDGTTAVFYIDSSSGTIYKHEYGGTSSQIDGGLTASAVSGIADYNSDGNQEIVYLDGNQELSYWNSANGKTSTGISVTGSNNYQYWLGGTTGPSIAKLEDGNWQDLTSYQGGSVYSGTNTDNAFWLGDGNGDIWRYDGSFTQMSGFPHTGSTAHSMTSNSAEILATGGGSAAIYNRSTGQWTDLGGIKSNPTFYSSANSYGSDQIGDFYLLGHAQTGGNPKAYVTEYTDSGYNRLSENIFGNPVRTISFGDSSFLAGDGGGNMGLYDGSSWTEVNTDNTINNNGNTIYASGWGTVNGNSFWLVGDGSGNIVRVNSDGTTSFIGNPAGNSVYTISYSEKEGRFLIGDGGGRVYSYDDNGLNELTNSPFGNAIRSLEYNPSTSVKKLGKPSDLEGDGNVEVPIINSNNNIELVNSDGSSEVVDNNYGSASSTPLGVLDWTGNPDQEILHVDSSTGELKSSTVGGSISTVTDSAGNALTGIDSEAGIAAGSRPATIPVLELNSGLNLNREGQPLSSGSWTQLSITYNASTGEAGLFFDENKVASGNTGGSNVNQNSDDFKIANGQIDVNIDETQIYNNSSSKIIENRLLNSISDSVFEGSYTTEIYNPEGKVSWDDLELSINTPSATSVTAEVFALNNQGDQVDSKTITSPQDGNNSLENLKNARKFQIKFSGTSDNILNTWEIFGSDIYFEQALIATNLSSKDYAAKHAYNISAVGVHADTDDKIARCIVKYSPEGDSNFYNIENYGGTVEENRSFGSGKEFACNSTINTGLSGIGYGPGLTDNTSFRISFEDQDGYKVETQTDWKVLPNREPSAPDTTTTSSSNSHSFDYTAFADDPDESTDEINSATIYAEDPDGNQEQFTFDTSSLGDGGADHDASASTTIDNSISGFEVGEEIDVWTEFTDKAGATAQSSTRTVTIPNRAPVTSGLSFSDNSGHSFDVTAVAEDVEGGSDEIQSCTVYASDGNGTSVTYSGANLDTGYGTTDEAQCSTTVSSEDGFEVGETITTRVMFTDKHGAESSNATDFHSIPNKAPTSATIGSLQLGPDEDENNVVDHTPELSYDNPEDPDNDNLELNVYVGTSNNPSNLERTNTITSDSYNSGSTVELGVNQSLSDGETYNVMIETCDGYGGCADSSTYSFTMNSKPVVNSFSINDSSPSVGEDVKLVANISDPQGTINNVFFKAYNETDEELILNESGMQDGEIWNSSSWQVKSNTSYNYSLDATDSFENTSSSGSFTPDNAVPEVISGLDFNDASGEHSFEATAAVRDADGDGNLAGFNITLSDGETTKEFEGTLNKSYGNENESKAVYTGINASTAESFEVGESIDVQITFYDSAGSTASTSTDSHEIPNSAPNINSIDISPNTSVKTTDDLTAQPDVTDPEGDNVPSQFYRWFRNGEETSQTSKTLDSSEISKGENWTVKVRAEDEYGALSEQVGSTTNVTIENSAPQIIEPISFQNSSNSHEFEATAAASDANGRGDFSSCTVVFRDDNSSDSFKKTGIIDEAYGSSDEVSCTTKLTSSNIDNYGWVTPEEKIETEVIFEDVDAAQASTTAVNTVPNRAPNTSLSSPEKSFNTSSSDVTFNWTSSDAEGDPLDYNLTLQNQESYNTTFEISKEEKKITGLSDGTYTWNVTAIDSYGAEKVSNSRKLTVDTTPPELIEKGIQVINSSRDIPLQNQSVKCYSRWSDNYELDRIEISDTETEVSETVSGPWANRTISAPELQAGPASCEFTAFDHLNNSATKEKTFDVVDIEKPNITGLAYSPTSQDKLDPENKITVNATVEDNFKIDTVKFSWRKEGGSWNESTVGSSQKDYSTEFTPPEEGTYEFNYTAVDVDGNMETVNETVEVEWEYTWRSEPEEFEGSSTLEENLVDPRPLTIENTGDFPLNYTLQAESESNLDLSLDQKNVYVPVGEKRSIGVEASLLDTEADDEGIYSFMLFLDSTNSSATPQETNITGQATFTLDAPYLTISRGVDFPLSINTGTSDVGLPVEITNDGTQEAKETEISYDIPSAWSSGSTSSSLGNISTGDTETATTSVDIPSDTETGTYTVNITASTNERTFEESFDVDINSNETTVVEEGGGGGGFGGGGGGPTSQEQVEQQSDQIFNTTESFEIVRGADQNFTVEFQNPTKFNLTNITANVEGIQSQYLNLKNPNLGDVKINESKNITVQITAPEYFQTGDYTLNFNITGKGVDGTGPYADTFDFTLNKEVSLGVRAIPRENASELLNQTRELIDQMQSSNLSTEEIESLASEAENSLESGDYSSVRESYQQAQNRYQTAREVRKGLKELESQINSAEASGLSVGRSRQLASLAEAAMDRGAYSTAADRLEEARSVYQLQTAGEVNWIYEIRTHWKPILAGIIITAVVLFLARLRYRLHKIRKRLKELESEEKSIEDLKIQKQKKAFEEKDISLSEYEDSVEDYNEQIVNIIEERVSLETEKANITNFKRRDSLAQERDQLKKLIEETQRDYVEGNISDDEIYQEKVEELTSRLSEIEGEIAEIDAKAKVRSQSRVGRMLEHIPIVSSGGKVQ